MVEGDQRVQPDLEEVLDAIEAIQDDRSAVVQYRDAHEQFQYGRSELDAARIAFDEAHWGLAIETFQEAKYCLDAAANGFSTSRRFAEADGIEAAAATAAETARRLRQATEWFATAARHRGEGDRETAREYHDDAVAAVEEVDELPALDTNPFDGERSGEE